METREEYTCPMSIIMEAVTLPLNFESRASTTYQEVGHCFTIQYV